MTFRARVLTGIFLLGVFDSCPAQAGLTVNKLQLENFLQDRVKEVVEKIDPSALVRVEIKLRKVQSMVPLLGYEVNSTPLEYGEDIGPESIERIKIKITSELESYPDWIVTEMKSAAIIDKVKIDLEFVKAPGSLRDSRSDLARFVREDLFALFKTALGDAASIKYAVWGGIGVLTLGLILVAIGIFGFSSRMTATLTSLVDGKLVPALSSINVSGGIKGAAGVAAGGDGKTSIQNAQFAAAGGIGTRNDIEDLPVSSILAVLTDCYWTGSDGYANYIWSQLKTSQRETVLKADFIDPEYLSFIRTARSENLGYHSDIRYLNPSKDFDRINQEELLEWVRNNFHYASLISPIRFDQLDLTLEERVQIFLEPQKKATGATLGITQKSALRTLPAQFRVKKLTIRDEEFLWENHQRVPRDARFQLRSLVWLGLAPAEYRRTVLAELDARQIAEAWSAPEPVLNSLKEVLPAKKLEMVEHFIATTPADRGSEVYGYLVDAGQRAPESDQTKQEAA